MQPITPRGEARELVLQAPPQWFIDHARQMQLVCGACIQCVQVYGIRPVAPPRTLRAWEEDLQESLHYEDLWDEYKENLRNRSAAEAEAEWV